MPPLEDDVTAHEDSSVRSDILAAFKSKDEPAEASPSVDSPATPEVKPAATPASIPAAAKDSKDTKDAAPAASSDAPKAIDPPARWTREEKEEFAALDPAVQRLLLGRNKGLEADYTKKMMEISSERKRFSGIEAVLAPRRNQWAASGLDDAAALNHVMQYWDHAQRDPVDFIKTFAQQRGIDLASAFAPSPEQLAAMMSRAQGGAPGQPGAAQASLDPYYVPPAVARDLAQLRKEVQTHGSFLNQRAQQEHQAIVQAASSELKQFVSAKDEHGQSLYPFFEELRGDMKVLMESGRAETLEDAYDMASRMNKDVFTRIQETTEIKRKREDEARRAAEAERARKAAASVSPSSTAGVSSSSSDDDHDVSIRALLERGFKEARASSRI